jgi:hypothetical protein
LKQVWLAAAAAAAAAATAADECAVQLVCSC